MREATTPRMRTLGLKGEETSVVVARVKEGHSPARAATAVERAISGEGGRVRNYDETLGIVLADVPANRAASAAARASRSWGVSAAEVDGHAQLLGGVSDSQYEPFQSYLKPLGIERAWKRSTGAGALIAIIDSGIDESHPELDSKIVGRWNAAYGGVDVWDEVGHGTQVAGVAAAETNNGRGVAGVGRDAKLLIAKVADRFGNIATTAEAQAIVWAADMNADVINVSLGSPVAHPVLAQAVSYARSRGSVVVAAAGNEGDEGNYVNYPAGFTGVLAVGATDGDERASFSQYGSWVDVAAPGEKIRTTAVGGGYAFGRGTSFSSPIVAGEIALLRAARPDASESTIRRIVKASGSGVAASGMGTGRVSISDALDRLLGAPPTVPRRSSLLVGATEATMRWSAPARSYVSPVSGYQIQYRTADSVAWLGVPAGREARSRRVSGLTPGETYEFRVRARNGFGFGPASSPILSRLAVPTPVRNLVAGSLDRAVRLSWEAPLSDGGLPLIGYRVSHKVPSGEWVTRTTRATGVTLSGLSNGVSYPIRVWAYNSEVAGPEAEIAGRPSTVPGKPSGATATSTSSGGIRLTWIPPATNGGSAITGYRIEARSAGSSSWAVVGEQDASTGRTIEGLTGGTRYEFRVAARNARGLGASGEVVSGVPVGIPGAPSALTVSSPAAGTVDLAWQPPSSLGGAGIESYLIQARQMWSASWSAIGQVSGSTTSFRASGLADGAIYEFRVTARNLRGYGPASPIAGGLVYGLPASPVLVEATSSTPGSVTLTWKMPTSAALSKVTGFLIESRHVESHVWAVEADTPGFVMTKTISGLAAGQLYEFRVAARNDRGLGARSGSLLQLIIGPPSSPGNVQAHSPAAGTMQLSWTTPTSDGGEPVESYLVEHRPAGANDWTSASEQADSSASAEIRGLRDGALYEFRVRARNTYGLGPAAMLASRLPARPPSAPVDLTATSPQSGSVALTWSAPLNDGGMPISSYRIELRDRETQQWTLFEERESLATARELAGLVDGTPYEFRVLARNLRGLSAPSAVIVGTPYRLPGEPGDLVADSPASGTVALSWSAPSWDGGSRITGYRIESRSTPADPWAVVADLNGAETSHPVTGLADGTRYEFRVVARNARGEGPASGVVTSTPFGFASAPSGLEAFAPASGTVKLSWQGAAFDGGAEITAYRVEMRTAMDQPWSIVAEQSGPNSRTVTGLSDGIDCEFRVAAVNARGVGPASRPVTIAVRTPTPLTLTRLAFPAGSLSTSADGRFVVFTSYSSDIVPGDTNGLADVFVYDTLDGTTRLVSVSRYGTAGFGHSFSPSISADGRFVAFESYSQELVAGDRTVGAPDVFVRDLKEGVTVRVSVAEDGSEVSGQHYEPVISADGRFVAFTSTSTSLLPHLKSLVPNDTNGEPDIFVKDLSTGQVSRVSVTDSDGQASGLSHVPSISSDGRFVAFSSTASNLVGEDTNYAEDVFVRDRLSGTTTRVSVADSQAEAAGSSQVSSISADGRFVAFTSWAPNLVPDDSNNGPDVFVRDTVQGRTIRASVDNVGAGATADSWTAPTSLSSDGRFVLFESLATDLVPGDTNNSVDVFVRDLVNGTTTRVTVSQDGTGGDGWSGGSAMSPDGRFVMYYSAATNLAPGGPTGSGGPFVALIR